MTVISFFQALFRSLTYIRNGCRRDIMLHYGWSNVSIEFLDTERSIKGFLEFTYFFPFVNKFCQNGCIFETNRQITKLLKGCILSLLSAKVSNISNFWSEMLIFSDCVISKNLLLNCLILEISVYFTPTSCCNGITTN